jgi:tyrosyl-tRNA synthetase
MSSNELLTRAVSAVTPKDLAEKKLANGKPIRIYWGIDPTGSKLHLGHAVPLRKFKQFQDAGHEVIFLIGDFTATIGDPTGQEKTRKALTSEEIKENFRTYREQAEKILDFSTVNIRYNSEWYDKMNGMDFMSLTGHFTVQQMMQRDMFKERMKWKVMCTHCKELSDSPIQFQNTEDKEEADIDETSITCSNCGKRTVVSKSTIIPPPNPVSSIEILYPILQGYDSVMLDVDGEIGGNDQLFNMLCGRKLQKAYGKREKFVLTVKLLEGTDGRKMSKTYNNCIYLTDEANDMYGKVMSINDELITVYMECCTDIPMKEIAEVEKAMKKGDNPKTFKTRLAREIITLYHGKDAADSAEKEFENVFKDKGVPEDMPEAKVKKGALLLDILVKEGLISSKSEGRRLIEQGGVKIDDKVVSDVETEAKEGIYRIGKRKFLKII